MAMDYPSRRRANNYEILGVLKVGSEVTPTNVTEGDITATRIFGAFHGTNVYAAYADADQEVTTATLATSTELTATLAAGNYFFRASLFTLNDGAAEGVKLAVTGTATLTALKGQVFIYDDTLNSLAGFGRFTAIDTAVGAGLSSGSNYNVIEGNVRVSVAGTFAVAFAQNAAGANAGVHIEVDSSWVLVKI